METIIKTIGVKEILATGEKKAKKENLYLFLTIIFMGAGFVAPLLGMVFAVVHSILGADFIFSESSTILFVAAIPLLFIGSHFMDVERENRKNQKYKGFPRKIRS